jgi:phospholipid/cholesterol/gamma-HCH transport system substrate-binding protein
MSSQAMPRSNYAETLVGVAVVAIALVFAVLAYYRTGASGASGYEVNARMAKVDGLAVGTDVRLAGIKIGSVSGLTLDPSTYLVTVHMNIRNDIKLPVDSSILVTQAGFLGGQYLSITPGGDDAMMAPGALFESAQGSIDMMNLIGRFANGSSLTNQAPPQKTPGPVRAPDPGAGP